MEPNFFISFYLRGFCWVLVTAFTSIGLWCDQVVADSLHKVKSPETSMSAIDRSAYDLVVNSCSPISGSRANEARFMLQAVMSSNSDIIGDRGLGAFTNALLNSEGFYFGLRTCWPNDQWERDDYARRLIVAGMLGTFAEVTPTLLQFVFAGWLTFKIVSFVIDKVGHRFFRNYLATNFTGRARKIATTLVMTITTVLVLSTELRQYIDAKAKDDTRQALYKNDVCRAYAARIELLKQIQADAELKLADREKMLNELSTLESLEDSAVKTIGCANLKS